MRSLTSLIRFSGTITMLTLLSCSFLFCVSAFADTEPNKDVVAVTPFTGNGLAESEEHIPAVATSIFTDSLFHLDQFILVEKSYIDEVLNEVKYQHSGICDVKCAVSIGEQLTANLIVLGEVSKLGTKYILRARIVDVEKATLLKSHYQTCSTQEAILDLIRNIALELATDEDRPSEVHELVSVPDPNQTAEIETTPAEPAEEDEPKLPVWGTVSTDAVIKHRRLKHFVADKRIVVTAHIKDDHNIKAVRCYFRTNHTRKYFISEMKYDKGNRYTGTLPAPSRITERIEYFYLVVNSGNQVYRSQSQYMSASNTDKIPSWQLESASGLLPVYQEIRTDDSALEGFESKISLMTISNQYRYGYVVKGIYSDEPILNEGGFDELLPNIKSAGLVKTKTKMSGKA